MEQVIYWLTSDAFIHRLRLLLLALTSCLQWQVSLLARYARKVRSTAGMPEVQAGQLARPLKVIVCLQLQLQPVRTRQYVEFVAVPFGSTVLRAEGNLVE